MLMSHTLRSVAKVDVGLIGGSTVQNFHNELDSEEVRLVCQRHGSRVLVKQGAAGGLCISAFPIVLHQHGQK